MEFIETSFFTKLLETYMTDEEYAALQGYLLSNPEAGKVVRGSGGVRKLRWAIRGKGKRGGARIIYHFKREDDEIWLLTIYGKSERESIPAHILRRIAEELKNV